MDYFSCREEWMAFEEEDIIDLCLMFLLLLVLSNHPCPALLLIG